ncbi:hypothetical protein M0R72_08960 [Candidatus Pacearchaeota archaeon]|nr:hypothetical protein [Candidatus Pacearchaeota archaeon]
MDDENRFDEGSLHGRELDIAQEAMMTRAAILEIGSLLSVMAARTRDLQLSTVRDIRQRMQACSAAIRAALEGDLG